MIVKSWKQSITLWFNFASVGVVAALYALEALLPAVSQYVPGKTYAILCVGVGVINAVLRAYKTWQPLDTNSVTK